MQTRDRPALLPPLVLLLGIGVLEALLLRIAGPPSSHFHVLTDLLSPMAEPLDGILAALGLAAQSLAAYLVLALGLRTLTHLPGVAGHVADQAEHVLTIPAVRRSLDALLGGALIAQLALTPAGTGMGAFPAPPPAIATAVVPLSHRTSSDPASATAATASTIPRPSATTAAPPPVPLPIWLAADPVRSDSPVSSRPPRPTGRQDAIDTTREASPPPPGASAAGPAPGSTAHDPSQPGSATATMRHTVEPGDTLWDIGAAHLPADARAETIITRYWRRIYGANRGALGPDPDLVRPGVTLSIPPYASTAAVPVSQDAPRATAPTWPQPGDRTDAPPYRLP